MAFSQSDVDDVKAAIATGALEVQHADGRKTTYRSFREMRDTLRMMQAEVAPAAPVSRSFVGSY